MVGGGVFRGVFQSLVKVAPGFAVPLLLVQAQAVQKSRLPVGGILVQNFLQPDRAAPVGPDRSRSRIGPRSLRRAVVVPSGGWLNDSVGLGGPELGFWSHPRTNTITPRVSISHLGEER